MGVFDCVQDIFGCIIIPSKSYNRDRNRGDDGVYVPTSTLPGNCLCMEYRRSIEKNKFVLTHDMEPDDVLLYLVSKGHFSSTRVKETIQACPTRMDKNEKLLDFLMTRTNQAYIDFLEALRESNQQHLAELFATHPHVVISHRVLDSNVFSDKTLSEMSDQIVRNLFLQVLHLQQNGYDGREQLEQAIRLVEAMNDRNLYLIDVEKGSTILTVYCKDGEAVRSLEEFVSTGILIELVEESLKLGGHLPKKPLELYIDLKEEELATCYKYFASAKKKSKSGPQYQPSQEELLATPALNIPPLDKLLDEWRAKRSSEGN